MLSGGGSLGAIQAGMLQGLNDAGIRPDLVLGTSVGALNAAFLASHPNPSDLDVLAEIWADIRRDDVFPLSPLTAAFALLGRGDHLVPAERLQSLIERYMSIENLEDTAIPLHVIATDVLTGMEVVISSGAAVPALMASAAIPAVFPPVELNGRMLMDGGVANNSPLSDALELGATDVYLLPSGYACGLTEPPRSALGMALHSITFLIHQRLVADVPFIESRCRLHVVPPLCPLAVSPADFSHGGELVARGRRSTSLWLQQRKPVHDQVRILGFHRHHLPGRGEPLVHGSAWCRPGCPPRAETEDGFRLIVHPQDGPGSLEPAPR